MKNKNRQIFALILVVTITLLGFSGVLAQSKPANPRPPAANQAPKKRSTWEAILLLFRQRKEPNLGSRGLCPISPGLLDEKNIIWSDRPLFLWQGNIIPLEIRVYSPFDPQQEQQIIWRENITKSFPTMNYHGIPYGGKSLEAGKTYDWEIFNPADKSKLRRSFQIMTTPDRDRLNQELTSLTAQLQAQGMSTEAIALERANYFAERSLWSDALQSMSSVSNPSPEFSQKVSELLSYLCDVPTKIGS
jgi:hypothetical protein